MVKPVLTEADRDAVEQAVTAAERTTRAEIVCVVTRQVPVSLEPALIAGIAAALALAPLLVWAGLDLPRLGGGWDIGHAAAGPAETRAALLAYALLQAALFGLVAGAASLPSLRRRLTPAFVKRRRVHEAALKQFRGLPLAAGADRTGVMIFVSMLDRQVEIVADEAVHAACGEPVWRAAVDAARAGLGTGKAAAGLAEAVRICGAALSERFPAEGSNPNLLPGFGPRSLSTSGLS